MWPAMHRIWSTGDFSAALGLLTSVHFVCAFVQLPIGSLVARLGFLAESSPRCRNLGAAKPHRKSTVSSIFFARREPMRRAPPAHMQPCVADEICPLFWAVALAAVAALLLLLVLHSGFQSIDRFMPPSEPFLPYFITSRKRVMSVSPIEQTVRAGTAETAAICSVEARVGDARRWLALPLLACLSPCPRLQRGQPRPAGHPARPCCCIVRFEQRRSARVGAPLVELALFRDGRFVAGILMALAFYMLSSFYLTFSVYLQGGLHLTPLDAAFETLPFAAGFFVASLVPSHLVRCLGVRALTLGFALQVIGFGAVMLVARNIPPQGLGLGPDLCWARFRDGNALRHQGGHWRHRATPRRARVSDHDLHLPNRGGARRRDHRRRLLRRARHGREH
jgi:hypothetical protein